MDTVLPRMTSMRSLLTLTAIAACAVLVPSTASAATIGISDQQAASFESPLYAPLKLKVARYIAPYDVMDDPIQYERLASWIENATDANQKLLISFEHSRRDGLEAKVPTNAQFKKEMVKFNKQFGTQVEAISPWNEVNVCQKNGRTEGQPPRICKVKTGPKIVAGYYTVARQVFSGKKIVALDILDSKNVAGAVSYVKAFRKVAKPTPKIWGIHNYSDTNRGSTSRTKALIKAIGTPKAEVWLTETGGQLRLNGANFGQAEAAKALKCMFSMPKLFPQIKRLYIYQFHGARTDEAFDAGLVDNTLTKKRKGYTVVQKRQSAKCKP